MCCPGTGVVPGPSSGKRRRARTEVRSCRACRRPVRGPCRPACLRECGILNGPLSNHPAHGAYLRSHGSRRRSVAEAGPSSARPRTPIGVWSGGRSLPHPPDGRQQPRGTALSANRCGRRTASAGHMPSASKDPTRNGNGSARGAPFRLGGCYRAPSACCLLDSREAGVVPRWGSSGRRSEGVDCSVSVRSRFRRGNRARAPMLQAGRRTRNRPR